MDERLEKQLAFSLEIDKVKNILRQTHLSDHGRRENDAEHSWHMAVMAYLLREYANEPVDIGRVMLMCLIHDIVEIDAGDTYAYDSNSQVTQKEREDRAKERIFALLPEDQKRELISLFDEFEANETPEVKYAQEILKDKNTTYIGEMLCQNSDCRGYAKRLHRRCIEHKGSGCNRSIRQRRYREI